MAVTVGIIRIACSATFAVALAGSACPVLAQASRPSPASISVQATAALPPDLAYARFIALIRGHLLTGDELAAARQWALAARHYGFPREEIYGVIRQDLRAYGTPPFDYSLRALVQAAKARSPKQSAQARQKINGALAAADAALKARHGDWSRFVARAAVEVLKTVPDEYEDAVVRGRIVRPIGYQTARGFLLQTDRMLETAAAAATGDTAAVLTQMRAELAPVKQAFASVAAPKEAPIDAAVLTGTIAGIDRVAARLN